jgi:hypothetical protein
LAFGRAFANPVNLYYCLGGLRLTRRQRPKRTLLRLI